MKAVLKVFTLLFLGFVLTPNAGLAQRIMRVYLWDTTKSMQTRGVWKSTKDHLLTQLTCINNPDIEVVLMTFTETVQATIKARGSDIGEIIRFVESKDQPDPGDTNICGALERAKSYCRKGVVESIILFTDGEQNHPNKTCLSPLLDDWCDHFAAEYNSSLLYHKLLGSVPPEVERNDCIIQTSGKDLPAVIQLHTNSFEFSIKGFDAMKSLRIPVSHDCMNGGQLEANLKTCGGRSMALDVDLEGDVLVVDLSQKAPDWFNCIDPNKSRGFVLSIKSKAQGVEILNGPVQLQLSNQQLVEVIINQVLE